MKRRKSHHKPRKSRAQELISAQVDALRCHKRVFLSHKEARLVAAKHSASYGRPITDYRCPHCGWWHLTKREPMALDGLLDRLLEQ